MHVCLHYLLVLDLFLAGFKRMTSPNQKQDNDILRRRPHTRSCAPIWSLPVEVLLHLLKGLQIKDLLNLRSVKSLSVSSALYCSEHTSVNNYCNAHFANV